MADCARVQSPDRIILLVLGFMKKNKHLNIGVPWFDEAKDQSQIVEKVDFPSRDEVEALRSKCEILYKEQLELFSAYQRKFKRSDAYFNDSVMKTGTLSDKMASQAIQIRQTPFFCLPMMRQLVSSSEKKGRREAQLAAQHLGDLFCGANLLPQDRLLVSLARRPKLDIEDGRNLKQLMLWYFEDQLKLLFGRFVQALEQGTRDDVVFHKDQCLKLAFRLLMDVPEREKETLAIVINKAGDKVKRVSSRVPYLLGMLLQKHSNMRAAVVAEVERFLYKPSITESAQYYLTIFLTQVALGRGDSKLARDLVQIYFSFLQKLLESKNEEESKKQKKKKRKLRKLAKTGAPRKVGAEGSHTATPSKVLHLKVKSQKLNSKMLTALLTGVSRAFPYLEKKDVALFESQMDAFYNVIFKASFNKACHALSLLLKIMTAEGRITDKFYETLYQVMINPELKSSSKQALFLNVLYGAIRQDKMITRVRAFLKRLLQVTLHMEKPAFACAALVVTSEALRLHEEARDMILVSERPPPAKVSEQEEDTGVMIPMETDLDDERKKQLEQLEKLGLGADEKEDAKKPTSNIYNPLSAKPLHCHADNSCAWELTLLAEHNHPTVSLFAKQLLKLSWIEYGGDPLLDFSLASFLDRWAYKKPKQKGERAPAEHEARYHKRGSSFASLAPSVDSNEFVTQREADVREEEQFMYKYMKEKNKIRRELKDRREAENDFDEASDVDDLSDLMDEDRFSDAMEGEEMEEGDLDDDEEDLDEEDFDEEDFDEEDMEDDDEDNEFGDIWEEGGLVNIFDEGLMQMEEKQRQEEQEEKYLKSSKSKKRSRPTAAPKKTRKSGKK